MHGVKPSRGSKSLQGTMHEQSGVVEGPLLKARLSLPPPLVHTFSHRHTRIAVEQRKKCTVKMSWHLPTSAAPLQLLFTI